MLWCKMTNVAVMTGVKACLCMAEYSVYLIRVDVMKASKKMSVYAHAHLPWPTPNFIHDYVV